MDNQQPPKEQGLNRRGFVKNSALAAGGIIMAPMAMNAYGFHNSMDDTIKVALIGCGGRGTGAAVQALKTTANVKLVAMADAFQDRLDSSYKAITDDEQGVKDRVAVPAENRFAGFEGYLKAIPLADVVILATPPGFRPIHFAEAIRQNKHVFMEKPVATDSPGIRKVLETAEIAKSKKLNVVVGLQRHYQDHYRELIKRVHGGEIGDIVASQVYWVDGGVWVKERTPQMTEMEYQMRNWYYFNWLCGDHITEQHIHNLDVCNWAKNAYPVRAQGMGGREVRNGKEFGEIFDHHYVEFEYEDGCIMNSQCRHIKGTFSRVNETLIGTKGRAYGHGAITDLKGKELWKHDKKNNPNPYQVEHDELFAAIAKGEYKFADAYNGAMSTMTAILGRMATYSGKMIEMKDALASTVDLMPEKFAWDALPKLLPGDDGFYPVAIPGKTDVLGNLESQGK